ncbi:MAG: DUF6268 family outer membrane beta-barrel protein [Planctomycetaceae bacterium]|nr:DUF6268 family outer membrane beta-barrel protein [Planctomycetaceae bacterium]
MRIPSIMPAVAAVFVFCLADPPFVCAQTARTQAASSNMPGGSEGAADEFSPFEPVDHIQLTQFTTTESVDRLLTQPVEQELPLRTFKRGAIQKVSFSGSWLQDMDGSGLSSRHYEVSLQTGIPLGSFDHILGVTPSFRTDFIDAAAGVDVPSELYQVGVSFFYRRQLKERWSAMAIVAPSVRSDFTTGDDAVRIFGLGLLTWKAVPDRLDLSFGAVYLGRADLPVLPAVGLRWTPSTRCRLDLRFPQSRLSWRLHKQGAESETWTYTSLGIGGNTWAVTRGSGVTDELSLRDIRWLAGVERLVDGGGRLFCEAGLAFNRRLEYEQADFEQEFANAVVLQAGWNY